MTNPAENCDNSRSANCLWFNQNCSITRTDFWSLADFCFNQWSIYYKIAQSQHAVCVPKNGHAHKDTVRSPFITPWRRDVDCLPATCVAVNQKVLDGQHCQRLLASCAESRFRIGELCIITLLILPIIRSILT